MGVAVPHRGGDFLTKLLRGELPAGRAGERVFQRGPHDARLIAQL
jgi:hypothetical protein